MRVLYFNDSQLKIVLYKYPIKYAPGQASDLPNNPGKWTSNLTAMKMGMKGLLRRNLTPPKRERLPNTIVARLKTLILSKKSAFGERLPFEPDFAYVLKVLRLVVRKILMSLGQADLIGIKRGPQ